MDGSPLPEWMKPSNSKVIVLFNQHTWRGLPVDVAVPVGRRIPPRALQWLKQFAAENNRMLLHSEQIVENGSYTKRQGVSAYGPPEFQQEMAERAGRGEVLSESEGTPEQVIPAQAEIRFRAGFNGSLPPRERQ